MGLLSGYVIKLIKLLLSIASAIVSHYALMSALIIIPFYDFSRELFYYLLIQLLTRRFKIFSVKFPDISRTFQEKP